MNKLALSAALIATFFASGCTQRVADLTVASTKNVNLNSEGFVTEKRVKGTSQTPIFIVPLGVPSVEDAADNALANNKCAVALTDVVVDYGFFSFFIGSVWYDVEGNLVIDKEKPGCEDYVHLETQKAESDPEVNQDKDPRRG